MVNSVVGLLNHQWQRWLNLLKRYIPGKVQSPAFQLIITATYRRWGWLLLALGSNLFAAFFEGGTFGIVLLALGILNNDIPSFQSNPLISNSLLLGFLSQLTQAQLFTGLILLAILLQVLQSGVTFLGAVASAYLGTGIQEHVQQQVYRQILGFSFPCASQYKVGDLVDYATNPAKFVNLLINRGNLVLASALTIAAYGIVLVSLSVPLTIAAVVLFAPLAFFQKALIARIRQASVELSNAGVDLSKQTVESLQALRVIHTFARQQLAVQRIEMVLADTVRFTLRQNTLAATMAPVNAMVSIIAVGGFLVLGFNLLGNSGRSLLPELLTFITVLYRSTSRLQTATTYAGLMAQCLGPIARLDEILETRNKQFTRQGGQVFSGLNRAISFKDVSLQYLEGSPPTLEKLSFKLAKGTVTALVGASGAGKSSVVDLLLGLYEPSFGVIWVDGVNLQELSLESWRNNLGVVSQDTFVFNESIAENIRFGWLDATEQQVVEAAKAAQAHEFIIEMPEGYQTVVGERGYRLSGGQRQRLALARAILRQPEILILDEATSALDSQSERLVQQALETFQAKRTVLVIAHRLSTIINADQILVLDKGRLVEQGTHQELVELGGNYAHYWRLQS